MTIWIIIAVIIVIDIIIVVSLIYGLMSGYWKPLEQKFPGSEYSPDAVRREFQSISLDLFNLGWSVHITVDERYLHLDPVLFLRWFKAERISLPWEAVAIRKIGRWGGKADLQGGISLWAPAWALRLAEAGADSQATDAS